MTINRPHESQSASASKEMLGDELDEADTGRHSDGTSGQSKQHGFYSQPYACRAKPHSQGQKEPRNRVEELTKLRSPQNPGVA